MGTWLNILNANEFSEIGKYIVKKQRFQIDSNKAVFTHLQEMYNRHVQLTDKIICGGEEIIQGNEILTLIELLEEEQEKLKKIFLDEWEFHRNPSVDKKVGDQIYSQSNFDSTKAYLAENSITSNNYEIRFGRIDNLELIVQKKWMKISKNEISEHIQEYLKILNEAFVESKYLFFSYY